MAVYNVTNPESALASVEFSPVSEGNFSFFSIRDAMQTGAVRQWLSSKDINQEIVSETVVDGKTMLVTHGNLSQDALIEKLTQNGNSLKLRERKQDVDMWKYVSMLAVPGQFLQLASSLMRKDRKVDWGLFTFAASNLAGHAITWAYGAQKSSDDFRLHALKEQVNSDMKDYVPSGERLPSTDDKRMKLREDDAPPPSMSEKTNAFLERNSIYVGELLCRYLGAFSLAFPVNQWGSAMRAGSLNGAFTAGRNPNTLVHYAGLASLTGKTISFTAKTPDPYNPTQKTGMDNFRENYAFRTGGLIEAGAFGSMTYDALANPNRKIVFRGKEYRDYVGALGTSLFTIRYIVRHWAKFGEKKIDANEAFAHTTDALAKTTPENLPQAMAKAAADLTEKLKEHHLDYSEVYTRLMTDLYTAHHISLTNLGTEPEERTPDFSAKIQPGMGTQALAQALAQRQSDSFVDTVRQQPQDTHMGMRA